MNAVIIERQEGERKRKANGNTFSPEIIKRLAMTEHSTEPSELLNIVRRPLSPDVRLEVPASLAEYERVQEVLENEGTKYPQLWFDGTRNIAIVVAAPSAVHGAMAGGILKSISDEVMMNQGISSELRRGLVWVADTTNTRGLTRRGWDGALLYEQGNRSTLMIAVEVGVSQAYESLRAAISWSVCALRCPLGIAMSIREGGRGIIPDMLYYPSIQEADNAFHDAEEDFRCQLTQSPYGPLIREQVTWYGRVRQVILEAYRMPDENSAPQTLLHPSQSFMIVEDGKFVGDNVPPNLQEVVLGDCIPGHILSGEEIEATPVNFFRRQWFDNKFQDSMVKTAVNRMRRRARFVRSPSLNLSS
ncbi:hypothetical protein V1509DRAFT_658688 [Lipomyces kononenkoae]